MRFILAFVFSVTFAVMPLIAFYMVYGLINEILLVAIFAAVEFFAVLPVFSGMFRMAGLALKRKEYGFSELFFAFSSIKNYFWIIFMNFVGILRLITPFSVGSMIAYGVVKLLENSAMTYETVEFIGALVCVAVAAMFIPLAIRFYAVSYLVTAEELGVIKSITLSWKYSKKNIGHLLLCRIRQLPLCAVSLAALLIPFVTYTAPYLACYRSIVCAELMAQYEKRMMADQIKNDIPEANAEGMEEINE